MNLSPLQMIQKKKTLKEYWIIILALVFFYAIVCVPISIVTQTNAVVMDSPFPLIWETLMQVLNYVFYWISFAYLIYFLFSFGMSNSRDFFVAYALNVLLRYGLNQFVTSYLYGMPSVDEFISNSLSEMIFFVIMDLLQMVIATWIAYLCARTGVTVKACMPVKKLFDFKNPLISTAFKLALIPAVIMILQRIVYDLGFVQALSNSVSLILGIIGVVIFYLADVLCVLIGHFVILLYMNRFFLRDEKIRIAYEAENK